MKRIFIMLIVAMLSFSVDAQNLSTKEVSEAYAEAMKSDVTMFLGIPVDGTVSSMKQKLIAKGFKQDSNMLSVSLMDKMYICLLWQIKVKYGGLP